MIIIGLLRWWYGEGIVRQWVLARQRIEATADYFSITLLLRTLFAPFRQISAGKVDGPLGVKWHAWMDRLVSRCVGAVIRSLTIVAGLVGLLLSLFFAGLRVFGWVALPVLPVIGFILTVAGWVPWIR